tara:strand:- start:381 stop:1055 length:675 start_codon:yes stop_codon:yes gene_type:complete
MAFGGVHPFMLKSGGGGGGSTGVVWDVLKWRCDKGKPSWDLSNTKFLGIADEVNHTISNVYGESTHYAEFLVSVNNVLTGAGVVSPEWFTGYCSSDSAGATPTSSLNSYMTDQAGGVWKTDETINCNFGNVTVDATSVTNRIGIEVDVESNIVRFYEVESNGNSTLLDGVTEFNGVDFDPSMSGTPRASWAATSERLLETIVIYGNTDDWWGTPTSGYVEMTES